MPVPRRSLVSLIGLLLLAACAKESSSGSLIATTANLTIVAPAPGTVFTPDQAPVQLALEGGEVLEEASTDVQPDTGHVHVTLDDQVLTVLAGLEFDLVEVAGEPLTPGLHLLEVEFVAANHVPFSPREIEQLTFTVKR